MLTPIHGSNPPTQDVNTIRRILEERRIFDSIAPAFSSFQETIRKIWSDIENLYRLHRESGDEKTGGGGGTQATAPKKELTPYPLCNIISEDMAVGYNEYAQDEFGNIQGRFESSNAIMWALLNREPAKLFVPVYNNVQILEILGTIWFEPKTGVHRPQQHYIKCNLFQGSPDLTGGNLLGFDFGFERFNHPLDPFARGKFFLDVFEYPQETTNSPPSLITKEISISSRKYYSQVPILEEVDLMDEYYENGLWCKLNLTIFVQ
jgi:hypothetical protein